MYCEYTLSIWPVIADNIRTKQQLCPCVVVSMVVRLGKRVQSLGETTHVQQQLCVCILLTWVSTDLIGVGVQSFGELPFGVIVSGADRCILKGGTDSRGVLAHGEIR